ncbi:HoxN/HupN/NixA family nickel/cobalt transporter [Helicobacter mustelae]|uniref:Nickel/cobalt efflux system n=1 Tax=Helicobacter mustelae (strain ATCC 43772 / CCUG 25715 / CIP 103759 / LMG 18044 / NCTC 12198 / R85-136P) TaxID=679897 RepID=D3UG68_HELM1|nr:HoxN/HupN/NixA family nickel/cobalt transporter [Helicobacter mustelae]CBG39489.1 Nickel transport protein NixA [Helicobacter mustelae 12198]SQH71001.1 nickel transport protein NixA [Helicobacter mustelae]
MREFLPYTLAIVFLHALGLTLLFLSNDARFYALAATAYALGSRHAFDADHIACIDNTIRKLLEQKQNAMGVGFYFSMGHSSVVILATVASVFALNWMDSNMPAMKELGGVIGTIVSGSFLLLLGLFNVFILIDLFKVFARSKSGSYSEENLEEMLQNRGFMNRFFKPLFAFVSKSWHIYPIGFLFGLGFDTASEVALLSLSAGTIQISILGMLSLPILFAAGMSLFDTCDGAFMIKAYDWAFRTPLRKIYYNITITLLSVLVALVIGLIELFQVLAQKLHWELSGFLGYVAELDFGDLGFYLVFLFIFVWLLSYGIWRFGKIEQRWSAQK